MADVISLSDKVIIIASIVTAITTVVIALYAIFSYRLAKRIESQSQANQDMFHELLLSITSATLVAGRTVGESELATRLFKEQKNKLKQEIVETNKS